MDKLSKEYFRLLNDKENKEVDITNIIRKINDKRKDLVVYETKFKEFENDLKSINNELSKFKLIKE